MLDQRRRAGRQDQIELATSHPGSAKRRLRRLAPTRQPAILSDGALRPPQDGLRAPPAFFAANCATGEPYFIGFCELPEAHGCAGGLSTDS